MSSSPTISPDPVENLATAVWYDDLSRRATVKTDWLWDGYLARGHITLLPSQWKSGKTTLLSVLLARMGGGEELAGAAVAAGRAVVVSEEPEGLWLQRGQKLGYGNHVAWFCRPFAGKPTALQWRGLLDRIAEVHERHPLALAVIDPLATALPGQDENNAGVMVEALSPLHRLCNRGLAVLLVHHPRKLGRGEPIARGSGALTGFSDVLLTLEWPGPPDPLDRRRLLRARSRLDPTPPDRLIELAADGADYAVLPAADEFDHNWDVLRGVFEDADTKLTRTWIFKSWPPDFDRPAPATLWQWLRQAVADGRILQDGTGRKSKPFRYWLPEREPYFLPDLPDLEPLPPITHQTVLMKASENILKGLREERETRVKEARARMGEP